MKIDVNALVQIFGIVAPIVQGVIAEHRAATGTYPTDADLLARFQANVDRYLAEGAEWRASHPPT